MILNLRLKLKRRLIMSHCKKLVNVDHHIKFLRVSSEQQSQSRVCTVKYVVKI